MKELENKYKVSYSTIQRALSSFGLIKGNGNYKYTYLYEHLEDFINDWIEGYINIYEMEDKYHCTKSSLYSLAIKLGIKRKRIYERDNVQQIINMWKSTWCTNKEICTKYNISEHTLMNILHKNNIDTTYKKRKFTFNERYFQYIDNEHKAYWLGFIYADGSISSSRNTLTFSLKLEDEYLLQKLFDDIGSNKQVYHCYNEKYQRDYVYALLNHPLLKEDLINKGVVPNKTYSLKFPSSDIVPEKLIKHFIRGYFDGDGCISIPKEKYKTNVSVVGTKDFIYGLIKYLEKKLNITFNPYKIKRSSVYCISKSGRKVVQKWLNLMYSEATIYLNRKREKAEIALNYYKENNVKEMQQLIQKLNHASEKYYTGSPIMTDNEFDLKLKELKELEDITGIIYSNSPTMNVGYNSTTELNKVNLTHKMKSLDKAHTIKELNTFINNKKCYLSVKCDGLSLTLQYKNGKLVSATTRGNGEQGIDVLHHAIVFTNIPLEIPYEEELIIDGEAIIYDKDFIKINKNMKKQGKDPFKNSRNLAAGSLNLLDNKESSKRYLSFIAWKVIKGFNGDSNIFKLNEAKNIGFTIVPYIIIDSNINEENLTYIKDVSSKEGIPMDGCVIAYDSISYGEKLGSTSKFPHHSLAYKYEDFSFETTLQDIEWTMGKTATLTPTAIFDPVEIDGTIVERASLHNITVMYNTLGDTPHIGQNISVAKMNMIIPQVVSADKSSANVNSDRLLHIPKTCPICGHDTIIVQDNDSASLKCSNPECTGKLLGKLSHFVSREAINIDGFSEMTLQRFINLGLVGQFKDIYYLKNHYKQLINLEGFGKKSIDKLLENIEKSRNTTLKRFIYSLSIDLIGNTASKLIENEIERVKNPGTNPFDQFCNMISKRYNWTRIDGFGEKMQRSLINYFKTNFDVIKELAEEFNFEEINNNKSNKLKGLNFVVTGSVNHFSSRKELQKCIEGHNGKVVGSVSTKTNYLINNDINSNSSKNKKAKSLNIPIITEEQLLEMIK